MFEFNFLLYLLQYNKMSERLLSDSKKQNSDIIKIMFEIKETKLLFNILNVMIT
jgi:hypothetical protein